jgi:hypothetical protein
MVALGTTAEESVVPPLDVFLLFRFALSTQVRCPNAPKRQGDSSDNAESSLLHGVTLTASSLFRYDDVDFARCIVNRGGSAFGRIAVCVKLAAESAGLFR